MPENKIAQVVNAKERTMDEHPELRLARVIQDLEICQAQGMSDLYVPLRMLIDVYNNLMRDE